MTRYLDLAERILQREPTQAPLRLPSMYYDPPPPFPGDLDAHDEQSLAAKVCQAVAGMTAESWATLSEDERLPWLEEAAGKLPSDDEWLTLAAVARGLDWHTGMGKTKRPDSKKVIRLGLDKNEQGRISRRSVTEYCRSQGLDWNEKAATTRGFVADL